MDVRLIQASRLYNYEVTNISWKIQSAAGVIKKGWKY